VTPTDAEFVEKVFNSLNKGADLQVGHLKVVICGIENLFLESTFAKKKEYSRVYPG